MQSNGSSRSNDSTGQVTEALERFHLCSKNNWIVGALVETGTKGRSSVVIRIRGFEMGKTRSNLLGAGNCHFFVSR